MSLFDYRASQELQSYPFWALIMAAMRRADDKNTAILKTAYPEVWNELYQRYHAPGGILLGDGITREEE